MANFLQRLFKPEVRSWTIPSQGLLTMLGLTGSNKQVTEYQAMQVSAFYACVDLIAESIGALPFKSYQVRGEKQTEIKSGKLHELLSRSPDGVLTPFEYRRGMVTHLLLFGNAYVEIKRTPNGAVDYLKLHHPQTVDMNVPISGVPVYTVNDTETTRQVSHVNMIHIRNLFDNVYRGVSALFFAQTVLGLSISMQDHAKTYFDNGAMPKGVLKLVGTLRDPERKQALKDEIDSNFGGANVGKTMVLAEGSDYSPLATNNVESQLVEARKFQTEEIARLFRVPPQMIGHVDAIGRVGSSVEEMQLQFVQTCLQPICENIEVGHAMKLAPSNVNLAFDFGNLLRANLRTLSEHLDRMKAGGIMTANECRKQLGLNPMTGGDKLEENGEPKGNPFSAVTSN